MNSIPAQLLVACCATTGATLCYLISNLIGKEIMQRVMPKMLTTFREKVRAASILAHTGATLVCLYIACRRHGITGVCACVAVADRRKQ